MKKILFAVLLLMTPILFLQSKAQAAENVKINSKNFPDAYFRFYVKASYDQNQDGKLSDAERKSVQVLDVGETSEYRMELEYLPVTSLKGIEYFPNLKELDCSHSDLTRLDVSKNQKLEKLFCGQNAIKNLQLAGNKKLQQLDCRENELKKLDVTNQKELVRLYCDSNRLKKLNLKNNKKLREVSVSHNQLSKINLHKLVKLQKFYGDDNRLVRLSTKNNRQLTELYVNDNRITTMNLSKNKKLQYLYINNNCLISGCLMTGYTGMEMVKMEGQTKTVKAKKKKGGYLIPVPSLKKTNVISKVSKGKVKNKGIFVKGKRCPKKITYQYNMFTDGSKKTNVTLKIK